MKAVVVGSTFGSVYAEGIKIADDVELAGIVGRGAREAPPWLHHTEFLCIKGLMPFRQT